MTRGFSCQQRFYAVLGGNDALLAVVKELFADAIVQHCLVHKERNIKGKLSKRHSGERSQPFRRLRSVQGNAAAEETFGQLWSFLQPINETTSRSFYEVGEDLLALRRLKVPNTLPRSLLSTNAKVIRKLERALPSGNFSGVSHFQATRSSDMEDSQNRAVHPQEKNYFGHRLPMGRAAAQLGVLCSNFW